MPRQRARRRRLHDPDDFHQPGADDDGVFVHPRTSVCESRLYRAGPWPTRLLRRHDRDDDDAASTGDHDDRCDHNERYDDERYDDGPGARAAATHDHRIHRVRRPVADDDRDHSELHERNAGRALPPAAGTAMLPVPPAAGVLFR